MRYARHTTHRAVCSFTLRNRDAMLGVCTCSLNASSSTLSSSEQYGIVAAPLLALRLILHMRVNIPVAHVRTEQRLSGTFA